MQIHPSWLSEPTFTLEQWLKEEREALADYDLDFYGDDDVDVVVPAEEADPRPDLTRARNRLDELGIE